MAANDADTEADDLADLTLEEEEALWAEENGVPSIDEPFIQKYLDGRDALVAQEKRQRSDHAFRDTLSPMAREASAIVSAIRFQEQQTLWNAQYEDNLAHDPMLPDVYPGQMFSLAKKRIEQSKLYHIIKKMPKGALLHCHLDAAGDFDWLIQEALRLDGICIEADSPLDTDPLRTSTRFAFQYVHDDADHGDGTSIWTTSYQPKQLVSLKAAADSYPHGGIEGFKQWFKSRVTISTEDAVSQQYGPNDIWRKFIACFRIVGSLHAYEPIWRGFVRRLCSQLLEDGVKWVDIRHIFIAPFWREGNKEADKDYSYFFQSFQEEVLAFQATEEGKEFWGARFIWTTIRQGGTRAVVEDMRTCISMKQTFPDLIAGYDLVGQEDLGRSLAELTPELFWFKKACREADVDIPFFFHAGETLEDGGATDENIFDAILLGTRRIGHGFSLYKHPLLIEMVKDKKILIESCPVSNEVLRFCSSVMHHPLPALLSRGVSCCLANDDPAILGHGTPGMTYDFWQALQGWENLGLEGLASLAENSVRWAAYEDCTNAVWQQQIKDGAYGKSIRAKRMRQWAAEFEKFCQWVVLEYGPDTDFDTLD